MKGTMYTTTKLLSSFSSSTCKLKPQHQRLLRRTLTQLGKQETYTDPGVNHLMNSFNVQMNIINTENTTERNEHDRKELRNDFIKLHNIVSNTKPLTPPKSPLQQDTPKESTVASDIHTCEVAQIDQAPNSFYRRPLPESLIAFSSVEGRKLFSEALTLGYLEGYFALAEQFVSQSDPAYCGPATLSMCLNALNIDPNRLWKGPWRWFAEDMLDCCTPLDVVKKRGITFTEFACLAKCNGASVTSIRGDHSTLEEFRNAIKEATSQQSLHLVVSYSRKALGQTGQGHYSPIGGYHPNKDLALVMDVARFKYAPHWVPVEVLWNSMREIDSDTQRPRGYYLLTRSNAHRPPAVCRITSKTMWAAVASHLSAASAAPPATSPQTAVQLVENIVNKLPPEAAQVLKTYPDELHERLPKVHADMLKRFFDEIANSELCSIVHEVLSRIENTPFHTKYGPEVLCVLLLACPSQLFGTLPPEIRDDLARVRSLEPLSTEVQSEVLQIREQMFLALKSSCKQCKMKNHQQDCKMSAST